MMSRFPAFPRNRVTGMLLILAASCAGVTAAENAPRELTVKEIFDGELSTRAPGGFAWSPDGTRLALLGAPEPGRSARLQVLEMSTGRMSVVLPGNDETAAVGAYRWAPGSDAIVLTQKDDLFLVPIDGRGRPRKPRRLTRTPAAEKDPLFSPDGKRIGFLRDEDLFVIDLDSGRERRLTDSGSEERLNAHPDWVYEEEFDLRRAWWWSPDSSRIAYLQFDQAEVPRYPIVSWMPTHPTLRWQRYPKAGDVNAVVRLGVVPAGLQESPAPATRWMDLGRSPDVYIPRVAWAGVERLAVQRLDRRQRHLELLACRADTGCCARTLEENDPHWINIGDDWRFLTEGDHAGGIIWGSERDGFRHLYLYDQGGRLVRQLTRGDWMVTDLEAVDAAGGLVYFTATKDDPLQRQLYRVRLDGTGLRRLTRENGWHRTWVAPDGRRFVDSFSTMTRPPRITLRGSEGHELQILDDRLIGILAGYRLGPVEFVTVPAEDGASLPAVMIRPPDFDPGRKYPILVYVYGGPHVQNVRNGWGGQRGLWHQMMASRGYIVWTLDNRGAFGRGHAWETPIDRRMGRQELADQLAGIAYLKTLPFVDASRIGLWGWSYGGYMTLYSLLNAPGVHKAGVSVAPVTDWKDYDTIYTERYMGRPQENEKGYESSSPVHRAGDLAVPLLLVHGTSDDNVHMQNSIQMLNAFVAENKAVRFMAYPEKKHGIRGPRARVHLFEAITRFFEDNL
ncbi:MAG: DPP IV N-terminal domain-containing protein [Acidobacteriota bacterium]